MINGNVNVTAGDAIAALRARGVDQIEALLELATPEQLVSLCLRFDDRGGRVGAGWIVAEARAGHFADPEPAADTEDQLRAKYADALRRVPIGTGIGLHRKLLGPMGDPDCPGVIRVQDDSAYPVIVLRCTVCLLEFGTPVSHVHVLHPMADDPEQPF